VHTPRDSVQTPHHEQYVTMRYSATFGTSLKYSHSMSLTNQTSLVISSCILILPPKWPKPCRLHIVKLYIHSLAMHCDFGDINHDKRCQNNLYIDI